MPYFPGLLADLQSNLDAIVGRTLDLRFGSRFVLASADIPDVSVINVLKGVGIRLNKTNAQLTSASLQLEDTTFTEMRWKQIDRGRPPVSHVNIDIFGRLGHTFVSDSILRIASLRAIEGLHRFVLPPSEPLTKKAE